MLVGPPAGDTDRFIGELLAFLGGNAVGALMLPRGERDRAGYDEVVTRARDSAQARDVAVLIEGAPGDVARLGADGLHLAPGAKIAEVRAAVAALKPDFIVGAAANSRDEAMTMGELGVDYVMFGPLSGAISPAAREMARWWAETMEVPAVLSDPEASMSNYDAEGCEFIGLGQGVWLGEI